jgi:thiol:disulfide interchange protein DsbD
VTWNVSADRLTSSEWIINITASLRPGWHIYSQYNGDYGPVPTVITLADSEDYVQLGKANELGKPCQFYDSIYEMNIIWFAQQVTFAQKVKLNHPVPSLHGTIDYMTCNDHVCIPLREEFTADLPMTTIEH